MQRQRALRLEKLWISRDYKSLALRLISETPPRYFYEVEKPAAPAVEGEVAGVGDKKMHDHGNEAEMPQLTIPAATLFAFPPLKDDDEFSQVPSSATGTSSESSLNSSTLDQHRYLHTRIGDASCPQPICGVAQGSQIICLFVETGGRWCSRGFFKAVDRLSAAPQEALAEVCPPLLLTCYVISAHLSLLVLWQLSMRLICHYLLLSCFPSLC